MGPKILLIGIDGVIRQDDQAGLLGVSRESTVARVREELDRARGDEQVKAILLRIDTPGGGVTASDVIYTELMRFKRDRDIPVAAHFLGMATSGGYYIAMAADEITAEPTAVTGSIGVIFVGVSVAGLMERFGIEDQTITSGPYKAAGSILRRMTDEERAILQSVIDDLHARFRTVVATGRPGLGRERVNALSDGRIYSAPQALEKGLIDGLGTLDESIQRIERVLGVSQSRVVTYHRVSEWRQNLYARAETWPAAGALAPATLRVEGGLGLDPRRLMGALQPGFQYLWWPGAPAR